MAAALSLTAAAGLNCPKTGGIKALYIAPQSAVTVITVDASAHGITDLEFATSGNGFGKIEFKRGEAELTEAMENSNEVTINFAVPNPNAAQRFQLEKIRKMCEMLVVAELYDDERLLFVGYDAIAERDAFVKFQSLENKTGRAKTDVGLFNFNLMAEHSEALRVLTGLSGVTATTKTAIIAELLAATNV